MLLSLALLVYLAARIQAIGLGGPPEADFAYAVWQRSLLVFMTVGFYCVKLLLPLNLCYYSTLVIPYPGMGALDILLTLTGVVCTTLMLIFWRRGFAGMMLAWIGITLLPGTLHCNASGACQGKLSLSALCRFCLLAALLFSKIKHLLSSRIVALLLAFVVLLYSTQVFLRTVDYRDPAAYLLSCVRVMRPLTPDKIENKHYFEGAKNWFTTCRNLGYLFVEKKDPANAEYWFLRALDHTAAYFDPRYAAECHLSLGELYLKQGRIPDAQSQLNEALTGTDKPQQVYNLLGVSAAMHNDPGAAEGFFLKALEIDPGYASARANLARLQQQTRTMTRT